MSRGLRRVKRKRLGWTLLTIGAVSTFPLAYRVFGRKSETTEQGPDAYAGKVVAEEQGSWASDRGLD